MTCCNYDLYVGVAWPAWLLPRACGDLACDDIIGLTAGKPLAVCHSNSAQGSAEVSSANYEARAFGIRAGMFMAEAKSRCAELLVVPYEFDKYEDISEQVGARGQGLCAL
jgi:hypothetical protein